MTRAAAPYYIVLFALLNLVPLLIVVMFVGSLVAWPMIVYAMSILMRSHA